MGHIKKGGGLDKSGTKSYVNKDDCLNLQRYVIRKGDLLMCMTDMKSNVALLGHTALMDENDKYILNQRVGLIRANQPSVLNYSYIYILTNSFDFIENLRSRANSGVQVNLSTKEIKESLVVVPNRNIHKKFDDVAINLFEKIFILEQENERLIKLRDTLLPKLMSGEIRVPLECNEN
jgi:type I restriction enzyme S subunit